jgi:hypothetical protein
MIFSDGSDNHYQGNPILVDRVLLPHRHNVEEYIHKPRSVTISDNGLFLQLRFGRVVPMRWEEILWISAVRKERRRGRRFGEGRRNQGDQSTFYSVSYDVGRNAREKYIQVMEEGL